MKLKNIFLIALLMLTNGISAQTSTGRMPYGAKSTNMIASRWNNYDRKQYFSVRFGLNVSQIYYNGMESSYTSLAGFDFGLYSGWQIASEVPIFVETGIEYNGKGAWSNPKVAVTDPTTLVTTSYGKASVRTRQHFLEIPFVFKYKIHTGVRGLTVQPLFGGFLAFGVGGDTKYYLTDDNPITGVSGQATTIGLKKNTDPYFPNAKESTFRSGGYRAFDAGIRLGCGLAYTNFYFEMRYDIGLYNTARDNFANDKLNKIYNYNDFDNSIRTGCLGLVVGVEF